MSGSEPVRPSGAGDAAFAAAVAIGLAGGMHLLLGRHGLDLADEGFLLHGVRRTLAGDVPLRDFQAYEPGRYFWCAAWCAIRGDGFLALRGALAAFQALGLFCALLAARRAVANRWLLLPIGLLLLAWAFPRHKVFEFGLASIAVFVGVLLLERPTPRRHVLAGALVGLAAFFGRNHGLYAALGLGALVLLAPRETLLRRASAFALGVLAGLAPLLAMIMFVPGFGASFADSLRSTLEHGANLPLPYPWPWRPGHEHLAPLARAGVAAAFLLPVLVYPAGIAVGLFVRDRTGGRRNLLVAASFVGAAYAHHVAVRSDGAHLAQAIPPALLAVVTLPRACWAALAAVTAVAVPALHPLASTGRVPIEVAGDELRVDPAVAAGIDGIRRVFGEHVPAEERLVFMAPTFVTLYPILDKDAPTWRTYFLWPASDEEQAAIVRELETRRVRHAFVVETAIDGRADLMFRNSHALVWRHLAERFERVETPSLPPNHFLLRRRDGT